MRATLQSSEETMALKIGDIVQLKSGGPVMTVVKLDGEDAIACMWYAAQQGEFRTQNFPHVLLDEIEFEDDDDDDD
jgi:uncharacterized protein YodC (DUF2158 family)